MDRRRMKIRQCLPITRANTVLLSPFVIPMSLFLFPKFLELHGPLIVHQAYAPLGAEKSHGPENIFTGAAIPTWRRVPARSRAG
jgi:hypothetical protein